MTYDTVASLSQVTSLLMFVVMFLAVLAYALWPKNGPRFDQAQRRALDLEQDRDRQGAHMTGRSARSTTSPGVETTGHEWDGIKELNKPLPQWWLLTFYATIVWAIGYWVVYPAWPTLHRLHQGPARLQPARRRSPRTSRRRRRRRRHPRPARGVPLDKIKSDPELLRFAMAGGAAAFQTNCAPCHGRGAQGFIGYPNLNDDDWLWGGTLEDIQKTISFGIRSDHKETRASQMPRFGLDKLLERAADRRRRRVRAVALGQVDDSSAAAARGQKIFAEQCAGCHGDDGKGKQEQGAPDLTDAIWLYGGTEQADRREHQDRTRRRDAGVGRPPRPGDH